MRPPRCVLTVLAAFLCVGGCASLIPQSPPADVAPTAGAVLNADWIGNYLGSGRLYLESEGTWLEITRINVRITTADGDSLRIEAHVMDRSAVPANLADDSRAAHWSQGRGLPGGPRPGALEARAIDSQSFTIQTKLLEPRTAAGTTADSSGRTRLEYAFSMHSRGYLGAQVKVYRSRIPGSFYLADQWVFTASRALGR